MNVSYDVFVVFADKTEAFCGSFESVYAATRFVEELDKAIRLYGDIRTIDRYEIIPDLEEGDGE